MAKTVIVTGASGFLGRHVAFDWATAGHRVLGLGREDWPEKEWRAWGLAAWACGDVSHGALAAFGECPDVVVHCAGSGSVAFSYQDPAADFTSTVGTLLATLEFLRLLAPEASLVYPSSAAVYGEVTQLPVRVDAAFRPASPYGTHKLVAEHLCRSHARHFGLKVAIVRLFSLYGPDLRKQLLWDACVKFSKGEATFLGTGQEIRDWVQVKDAAMLMRVAADHADMACGVVNGASGTGITVREVLTLLREAFPGVPPLTFTAKAKAGDPTAYVGDNTGALAWGWHPSIPLQEGINEYAMWFQQGRT